MALLLDPVSERVSSSATYGLHLPVRRSLCRSRFGDVDDSLSEGLRCFLRQVVPNATLDEPVLVPAREFVRVRAGFQVRCAIGITFERNSRDGDDGALRERLFKLGIFRLTLSQAEPPAVIVDDDVDVIRIIEGRGAAVERGVVKLPLGRSELPDQLRKFTPVFFIAGPAAVGGEIELVPPLKLRLRRQREPPAPRCPGAGVRRGAVSSRPPRDGCRCREVRRAGSGALMYTAVPLCLCGSIPSPAAL